MKLKSSGDQMPCAKVGKDEWRECLCSVITNALTPTLLFDKLGDLVLHSKSLERLWDLEDKPVFDKYNILNDKQLKQAGIIPLLEKAFQGSIPESVEIFYDPINLARKGRSRWIRANAYPVGSADTSIDGVVVVMEDITSFKDNEAKVLQNNEILKNFMHSVSDALVIYDNNLNYIEVNKIAQEVIGRPREEIIGKNIKDIIPDIENTNRFENYLKILKTGETYEEEISDHPFAPGKILLLKAFRLINGMGITTSDITISKEELNREVILKKELEVLKDSAMDLVEMSFEEDIYSYSAKKLSSICDNSFSVINMLHPEKNLVYVKGIAGEYRYRKIVERMIGNPLMGKSFPYYKNHERLKTGKLIKLENGLFDITGGELSVKICTAIEKRLKIRQIYTIGFIRQGNLYGNALIISNSDEIEFNKALIEAFINQISIAIHRIASEKALFDSEERFKIAFTTSPDSVNINRMSDGVYVDINNGFTEITGYTREDVIGRSSLEKGIWVKPEERRKLVKELKRNGFVKNLEAEFRTKSGEIKVGLMSAHKFEKDDIEHIISITRDITSRKLAEQSLKTSEERYRVVAKQTGQIIYEYNILTGKISWAGAIEEVTGYSALEFAKVDINVWEKMVHPDDIEETKYILKDSVESAGPFDAEYRLRHKNGEYIKIEEHGVCIKDDAGTFRMLGSMADITEREKYQDSLKIAWEKAKESDQLKTAFLANLSHEIRTPMNAILGFSDLLMKTRISDDNKSEYISMINRSSHNLLNIINDIIDFSMIETGQLQIYKHECALGEILKELYITFKQYKILEGKDHLQLIVDQKLMSSADRIISDEERIKQVMSNLIANAIKYSEKGQIDFGYAIKSNSEQKKKLEFFVKDTGIGIDKDHHELIFERFRQLDDSNTRRYGGNGLGLSISRQIANLMGGDISVNSHKGKGSTFYFTIPYFEAETQNGLSLSSEGNLLRRWEDKKIIVAEDVFSNFQLIQSMLIETGIHIEWAKHGKEVLDIISNDQSFDLILMDIRMPVMNGYEATAEIRKTFPDLPIIALSANAMQSDLDKSIEIGCNDHISKPISIEILLDSISKVLS